MPEENMKTQNEEMAKEATANTEENYTSDENTSATAQAELNDKQAEENKELTDEGKEEMAEETKEENMSTTVIVIDDDDDATTTTPDMDDFQAKYEDMCNKYSTLETQMSEMTTKMTASEEQMAVYMAENDQLKQFKADIEANQMMSTIEYTLSEVMESMPNEKMEELREDAKNFSINDLNVWVNKVKAEAFSFSKDKKNNDLSRIAFPWSISQEEKDKNNVWNRI